MNKAIPYSSLSLIGIIVPEILQDTIKDALRGFPNIQPHYFLIKDFIMTDDLQKFIYEYEMLVTADPYIFEQLKHYDSCLPLYQINSRALQLYELLLTDKIKNEPKQYCFDLMQQSTILSITHQLQHKVDYVFCAGETVDAILEDHIKHAELGYFPVTTIASVFETLRERKLECRYLIPTKQELIVAFERVLLASKGRQNKEGQIVYGLIQFESITKQDQPKVEQILQQFTQQMDGHLIMLNPLLYSFITTRGQFERETLGYKHLPLLSRFKEELQINCTIGVGFGVNANDSGRHAKQALYQSNESGPNLCYIVREDNSVIGPIDTTVFINYEQYPLVITDLKLLERAEKAGMSASYISKLMGRIMKHQKFIYTAEELAQTLNITLRSANRILLKWLDAGLVDIIGEEKVAHRGRPKRIYYIQFLEDIKNQ